MKKFKFEPLSIRRTSEYIEEKIRETILDGTLKSGDRLFTEKEMAEQFGVSVVTLREALRALETLGLIEKRKGQRGGIFVSEINNESIKASIGYFLSFKDLSAEHLYEVRKIIEPAAIKLAVQKITQEEIEKLKENVSYCEEKLRSIGDVLSEKEFFELDQRNNDFHRMIAESTHNPILSLTIDYIMDFIPECETKLLILDVDYCVQNIKDHRDILEGIKDRDEEECEKRMLHHLERLAEYLANIKRGSFPFRGRTGGEEGCLEKRPDGIGSSVLILKKMTNGV
jgi:GntR family transcriptional repressor for pyruvate dehydrogenase complex